MNKDPINSLLYIQFPLVKLTRRLYEFIKLNNTNQLLRTLTISEVVDNIKIDIIRELNRKE